MANKSKLTVNLSREAKERLATMLRGGVESVRVIRRAEVLLQLGEGRSSLEVAANLHLSSKGVRQIGKRYWEGGLERALYEKPRAGGARLLSESEEQRIIAMVCAQPPEGRARWTVRLIAAEAVKRKLVGKVGRDTIRVMLQRHDLKPWREKNVVRGGTRSGVHRSYGRCPGPLRAAAGGSRAGGLCG